MTTTKTDLREFTKAELIELLTTDIAGWNRLYQEAREASDFLWSADLGSADLWSANLGSANLRSANLRSANLRSADLRYADLGSADLRSADLRYADLGSADLRSANLGSADLGSADLGSADLRYANLRYADLGSANLGSADLWSANLRSADLGSANLEWDHPLWAHRADLFAILDAVPGEVAKLREEIVAGRINGSVYEGECACLCGTIANQLEVDYQAIPGVTPNGSRPAEEWFYPIREGDVPADAPGEGEEWSSEGVFRASVALGWVDEWVASRALIAKALAA